MSVCGLRSVGTCGHPEVQRLRIREGPPGAEPAEALPLCSVTWRPCVEPESRPGPELPGLLTT